MEKKLEFTNRAKSQIQKITKSEAKKYFRIAVQGGGCSGFKYNFTFDDKLGIDDVLFEQAVIDKISLDIIAGSTVDFKEEMIGESFVINNPQVILIELLLYRFHMFLLLVLFQKILLVCLINILSLYIDHNVVYNIKIM